MKHQKKEEATEEVPTLKDLKKISAIVEEIRVAMMTAVDESGNLRSRPMYTQHMNLDDGVVWFFASIDSTKTSEIQKCGVVNLAYSHPEKNTYLSISGDALLSRDQGKIKELWSPAAKAWFPEGIKDPGLCLIRVNVEHAEYWDAPSSTMVTIFAAAKALFTGHRPSGLGDHKGLDYTARG
ncbi:MAG TPA: pyridoxamine 5'-phosphate oxidase family protein [Bdellovibrionota bacterium]|jgi:general stress protein 26|nr:pyridoxamine 5'-phosphate oxidase family protein [Bdellovibrionota bacterium]